jgi:hypothetical protein
MVKKLNWKYCGNWIFIDTIYSFLQSAIAFNINVRMQSESLSISISSSLEDIKAGRIIDNYKANQDIEEWLKKQNELLYK